MSIQIQKVTDKSFRKYGRILTGEYDGCNGKNRVSG